MISLSFTLYILELLSLILGGSTFIFIFLSSFKYSIVFTSLPITPFKSEA